MRNVITTINKWLAESCGYLLMLVMFMVTADVILRNLGFSIFGIIESAVYIVVAAVFFGLGQCEMNDGHVRISVLLSRLSPRWRFFLRLLMAILTLAIMAYTTYACFVSAVESYEGNEAVMANTTALYTWPSRAAIVVGMFFYCAQVVISICDEFTQWRKALSNPTEEK